MLCENSLVEAVGRILVASFCHSKRESVSVQSIPGRNERPHQRHQRVTRKEALVDWTDDLSLCFKTSIIILELSAHSLCGERM